MILWDAYYETFGLQPGSHSARQVGKRLRLPIGAHHHPQHALGRLCRLGPGVCWRAIPRTPSKVQRRDAALPKLLDAGSGRGGGSAVKQVCYVCVDENDEEQRGSSKPVTSRQQDGFDTSA